MSRVVVLKGGRSLERSVSLRSGARVEDALERLEHEVVGIDVSTDLMPRLREAQPDVAFVPGEAAFLDGRGRSSMRLNFSASESDAIREGIRRIGEVVTEQVKLYGTLTGEHQAVEAPVPMAEVVEMPTPAERRRKTY